MSGSMDVGSKHSMRSLMIRSCTPLVFKHAIDKWPSFQWRPEFLSEMLGDKLLQCKISLIQHEDIQWEPDCLHVKITMKQYVDWLHGETLDDNPLRLFDKSKFSCYIDYKYMKDMFEKHPNVLKSVSWEDFGLKGRDGEYSTIWIGSHGAYTPCHQDTYGFNLVAQIQGRKRWYLFNPDQTEYMYPTRIPYEESSVYSEVNVRCPDLDRHLMFKKTTPFVIELVPGDVLYVPHHWWHFVESLEPSISINTWVPVEEDPVSHLDEAICRLLYTCLSSTMLDEKDRLGYLNTGEELVNSQMNLAYIKRAIETLIESGDIDSGNSRISTSSLEESCAGHEGKNQPSLDNFKQFSSKFKDYTVTVACLCGVQIHRTESSHVSVKRKYNEEESVATFNVDGKSRKKQNESDTISNTVYEIADTESNFKVQHKWQKLEDLNTNDNYRPICGIISNSEMDEKPINKPDPRHAYIMRVGCNRENCNIEIFAASSFTFTDYLRFLETVFDYDSDFKETCSASSPSCETKSEADSSVMVSSFSLSLSSSLSSSAVTTITSSHPSRLSPVSALKPTGSLVSLIEADKLSDSLTPTPSKGVSLVESLTFPVSTSNYIFSEHSGWLGLCSLGNTCTDEVQSTSVENQPEKQTGCDVEVKSDDKVGEKNASYLHDPVPTFNQSDSESVNTHKLTINTSDVINSILNPNVIRRIGQVLMNKYKK